MRIPIAAVEVDDVTCSEAVVSVAVSNSVAVRVVPVDGEGTEYPEAAVGVVGTSDDADVAVFMGAVRDAVSALLAARGV